MARAPIGVPGSEPELILQVNAKADRKLRFKLPGAVYQVGPRNYLLALVPAARIVIAGTDPLDYAVAHFGERNRQQTADALAPLAAKKGRVASYAIRVTSDLTYAEVVAAAPTKTPLEVEMRVELELGGKKTLRSDPFSARMALRKDPGPSGNTDDTDEGSHIWDCHAHWYGMVFGVFGRYTLCHNKTACPAGTTCRCNGGGNCKGWCMCVCK